MWALRAAVRRGLRLSRVGRGLPAPRAAAPSCPARALAAVGRRGPGNLEGPWSGGPGLRADGGRSRAEDDEEEPEDADEDAEEELLQGEPLLPAGTQRVCLVHPDVKWGPGKPQMTRAEWQVAEATALVHTLDGWSVVQTMVVSTKSPDRKLVFGKGNFQHLTEKIRGSPDITCVFLNVERMAAPTKKELEAAWGVEVFDRFTVVLHIFRCNARTKEARLQVALAEIPLHSSRRGPLGLGHTSNLKRDVAHLHRGAGSRYIMGSGESFMQVQQRLLREKEAKIRKALDRLRKKRQLLRQQRTRREFPVVSVVGYTNCGEHPREDAPREGAPVSAWGAPAAVRTCPGEGRPVVSLEGFTGAVVRTPSTPSSYPEHYRPVYTTGFPPSTPSSCLHSHHCPIYTTTVYTVHLSTPQASLRLHRPAVYTITTTPSIPPPIYTVHPVYTTASPSSTPSSCLHHHHYLIYTTTHLHSPPVYTTAFPSSTPSSCLHHHHCPVYTTTHLHSLPVYTTASPSSTPSHYPEHYHPVYTTGFPPSTPSFCLHHHHCLIYTTTCLHSPPVYTTAFPSSPPSSCLHSHHCPVYTILLSTPSPPRLHHPPVYTITPAPSIPPPRLHSPPVYTTASPSVYTVLPATAAPPPLYHPTIYAIARSTQTTPLPSTPSHTHRLHHQLPCVHTAALLRRPESGDGGFVPRVVSGPGVPEGLGGRVARGAATQEGAVVSIRRARVPRRELGREGLCSSLTSTPS
uniref:GTP binding protein 6 (putative) n=1 Tax=Macaca mulatta TaxID=9544 RepID=A0A5F8A4L0_MACMU